jgi:hypothetical protein
MATGDTPPNTGSRGVKRSKASAETHPWTAAEMAAAGPLPLPVIDDVPVAADPLAIQQHRPAGAGTGRTTADGKPE